MLSNISFIQWLFYIFASLSVASAVMVITARHPVRSVLSLVLTFFFMAGVWMLFQAEFLSLILLLVYVGAVMTLFLFVVMMLSVEQEKQRAKFIRYFMVGFAAIVVLIGILAYVLFSKYIAPATQSDTANAALSVASPIASASNLKALGSVLYTEYFYPFQIAGTILLSAMIAAITLAYRGPLKRKVQDINKQIKANAENSVKLVKMSSEVKK